MLHFVPPKQLPVSGDGDFASQVDRGGESIEGVDEVWMLILCPEDILLVSGGELHTALGIVEVNFVWISRVRI